MKRALLRAATFVAVCLIFTSTQAQVEGSTAIDSMATSATVQNDSLSRDMAMQTDTALENNKRWFFGCGFGLNFVGGTSLSLSPNVNYLVSEKVSIGVGLQGNYISIKDVQSTTTIGGNIIAQYMPVRILTTLLEFSQLNVSTKRETLAGEVKDDFWESALFVGAGLNVSRNISLGIKYNLLYDSDESVYTSPILPFVNVNF